MDRVGMGKKWERSEREEKGKKREGKGGGRE